MIELDHGGFYYRPDEWVFRDYSFALQAGEVLALLGPNGRGKTTLLKAIVGLLSLKEGELRRSDGSDLGYVPQHHSVAFAYTVLDMVLMGRARHIGFFSTPSQADVEAARRALAQLSIGHFAERLFHSLSAGEQQLVMIARALAAGCDALILDEPTSSLDFKNQGEILQTLRHLARVQGMTVVFATHIPQHAALIADTTLLMYGPTDYLVGQTNEVLTDEHLSRLYGIDVRHINFTHNERNVTSLVPIF